ncbi:universal stress protein UspA-like protein [Aequorivita sublithincola DSM 14238]|uniref:Universal stress protein UspA-like protein n=1 Tax=Aequorivita sublithincola (strain DSM 14238 / LMG 21431 / ACAM 643 / 9-3) TaxID=746697 RepID=I3YRQ7_AEQSU|nr:universal stress protein [Aequorivita sublithincola]AFL79675.1 universal stress protein UspA-like protein [Aequorivita sublithincola DSM 14238]
MKKRILIPTDFSKNSWNALKYAMEIYKREDCEFFILHTFYHSGYSKDNLLIPEPTEKAHLAAKENAERNMEKFKVQMGLFEENDKHTFQYITEFGSFFDVLKKTVEKQDIELVVMGTQGETDNKTIILGSNAVNAMEEIRNCPVLAIPATVMFKDPNEIVFPTSFRTHYKEKELATLVEISRCTNAPIRILHIQKGKTLTKAQLDNKALLERLLDPATFTQHTLFDIDLRDGVRSFVQSRQSEMIAIVNKKHNFFSSIFSNPMVKELGKHTNVPLLAMHDLRN